MGVDCTMGAPVASLALESIGAFTSAGPSTAQTMAALCLRVSLFEELPSRDAQGEPVIGALSALPLDKAEGVDRLTTLAALALEECGGDPRDGRPLPLLLCVPEPGDPLPDPAALLRAVVAESPVAIEERASAVFAGGRIALFPALRAAARLLAEGGLRRLLHRRRRLARRLRRARRRAAGRTGQDRPHARGVRPRRGRGLSPRRGPSRPRNTPDDRRGGRGPGSRPAWLVGAEQRHRLRPRGARRARGGARRCPGDRARRPRCRGRSVRIPRRRLRHLPAEPAPDPTPTIWMPATVAGEMGAAYGPLAIAQAAFFLQKQVSPGPAALVLGAATGAARGAAVLVEPSAR